ncbi:inositol monophosphatase family protein [Cystoisospora suis]|uniref:Inositol monophosphatase family protein n=1 Tax=Cystoisospora suis TaxID=483139 RepID=A0A2C6KSX5_9APIC|nr:inositol monophosphatase family protein [Cystoisospora suis]
MGQAFSNANVSFCRTDIPESILNNLGGWEYDRICAAWAALITSDEKHMSADGTPQTFLADLQKLQRITGLSKNAAEQIGQLFSVRACMSSTPEHSSPSQPSSRRGSENRKDRMSAGPAYPMLEILVVTVVLGNLHRLTKLSLIFSLFDLQGEGRLSEAEFFLMCYFVFRGLAKAVRRPIPGYGSIEPLVLATFDDLQNAQCAHKHLTDEITSRELSGENLLSKVPSSTGAAGQPPPCGGSRRSSYEEAERAAALVEKLFAESEKHQRNKLCCRREMTLGEFIRLTLRPGSAIDLLFKGMHGASNLSIATNLAFRHSHQFQTRLFQNVFLVHQWLQCKSPDRVSNGHIRLTDLVSVCLDLAEKSADIVREVYNVIATDRRMALQGMVHIEMAPANEPGTLGRPRPQNSTSSELVGGDGEEEANQTTQVTGQQPPRERRKIPAYILTDLLVDQHVRRQVHHWWPRLRIEGGSDSLPDKPIVFKKLMDIFSSRLFGNPVCGPARLKCRIQRAEELKIRSVIQGGQEPWIELTVTQGYDNGRGPPIRVMGEAKTEPMLIDGEDGNLDWKEELEIELPDVRDNYYLVLTIRCRASDSDVVTVGRGSMLLSEIVAGNGWTDMVFRITPSNSPAVYFTSDCPRLGFSLMLEPQVGSKTDTIECSPSRLNGLDMHVPDVVYVDDCVISLHLENGHHSFSTCDANDMSSVAVSIGVAYRGKPVAGIAYFPFAESQSLVSFAEYGCLAPPFWRDPNVSQIEVPARPPCNSRRNSLQRSRISSLCSSVSGSGGTEGALTRGHDGKVGLKGSHFERTPHGAGISSLLSAAVRESSRRRRSIGEVGPPARLADLLLKNGTVSRRNSTQTRCIIPTGSVPISLRFLDAKEFFLEAQERPKRDRPLLLSSGKSVFSRVQQLLRQPDTAPLFGCVSGVPLKVSQLVRGEADVAVEFDIQRVWSLCGSDALIRSVGGSLVDEYGNEIVYNSRSDTSSLRAVYAFVDREILDKTVLMKTGPE